MGQAESFRRAKSGVLERGSVRPHWGPEREENCGWCGSASAPAVSEPTCPVFFRRRGNPCGRPQPSPYKGEGLAGDRKGRPYGGNALVALVR